MRIIKINKEIIIANISFGSFVFSLIFSNLPLLMINKLIPIMARTPIANPVDVDVIRLIKLYLVEKGTINIKEVINHVE